MPSDINDAIQQDEVAESLLSAPIVGEESATATDTGPEEAEEPQPADTVTEEPTEEADDWLPTEQEKVFPQEVLAKYAPRYGFTAEELQGDPRIARIVQDKLNSDIYINQLRNQSSEVEEEPEPVAEPTHQTPATPDEYWLQLERIAMPKEQGGITDPKAAQIFHDRFMKVWDIQDPAQRSIELTKTVTAGVLSLLNTVLPQMMTAQVTEGKTFFQSLMDQSYEGFNDSYEETNYERAFRKASGSIPEFHGKSLSEVGPKLKEAAVRLAGSQEDFDNLVLRDSKGKPLSPYQNAVKKYEMLGRVLAGQKLNAVEAKQFVEAGKKVARKAQIQKEAGNLGAGKSNGMNPKMQTNDDIFGEGLELYQREHGRI